MTKYTIKNLFKTDKQNMVVILKVGQMYHVQEEDSYVYHNLLGLSYDKDDVVLFPIKFDEALYNAFVSKLREHQVAYHVIDNGNIIDYTLGVDETSATNTYRFYSMKRHQNALGLKT